MSGQRFRHAAMILLAAAAPFSSLVAQDSTRCYCDPRHRHEPTEFERRAGGTLSIIQSRPTGVFGNNIDFGYGLNGTFLYRIDDAGWFSVRADAGFLQYGRESKRVPLSSTIGGRIQVDVATENYIVPLSIGAQVAAPRGAIRPYANAGVGGQFFFTQSSVEGADDNLDFANTTNQWDKTGSWVAGGGVYIPVYERYTKVMLDIGAQYVNGGRARYLKPGSIQDLPNNQIRITPMESDTHMVLVRFGVKISL